MAHGFLKNKFIFQSRKSFWKQFSNTTVAPPITITDSAIQAEGRCMAEILEKIGGKGHPWLRKFVSKNDNMHDWIPAGVYPRMFLSGAGMT